MPFSFCLYHINQASICQFDFVINYIIFVEIYSKALYE